MIPTFTPQWCFVNKDPVTRKQDFIERITTEADILFSVVTWYNHNPHSDCGLKGITHTIKPEYFMQPEARFFWETLTVLKDLEMSFEMSSFVSLCEEQSIKQWGELPDGLISAITMLFDPNYATNTRNVTWYVKKLIGDHLSREINKTLKLNEPDSFSKALKLGNKLDTLKSLDAKQTSDHHNLGTAIGNLLQDVEDRATNPDMNNNFKWNYPTFDQKIPVAKGHLIVIGGRSGSGKTTFAVNLMRKLVNDNLSIVMFSLEMTHQEIAGAMLTQQAAVSKKKFNAADLGTEEWDRLVHACEQLYKTKMTIIDRPRLSVEDINDQALQIKRTRGKLDAVFIDNIHIMGTGGKRFNSVREHIIHVSGELKSMAKDLNIPIFVLAQHNRNVDGRDDKTPIVSDLKESGSLEQDADSIVMTFKDTNADGPKDGSYIICRKNRHGEESDFKIYTVVDPVTGVMHEIQN